MPYYRCPACGRTGYSARSHSESSACPICSASLADAPRVYVTPKAALGARRALVARPEAVSDARRAITLLPLPEATREKLTLVVSELVTNSLIHAGLAADDVVNLYLADRPGGLVHLAVQDGGPGFAPPPSPADPLALGGRGLPIVAQLSETWGIYCDPDGCTVWSEVAIEAEPAPAPTDRTAPTLAAAS